MMERVECETGADYVLEIDWLHTEVAVFLNVSDYETSLRKLGGVVEEDELAFHGRTHMDCIEGVAYFSVIFISPDIYTIMHESSHLVDFLFERHGIEPCTETRAYFHTWIFKQLTNILGETK